MSKQHKLWEGLPMDENEAYFNPDDMAILREAKAERDSLDQQVNILSASFIKSEEARLKAVNSLEAIKTGLRELLEYNYIKFCRTDVERLIDDN